VEFSWSGKELWADLGARDTAETIVTPTEGGFFVVTWSWREWHSREASHYNPEVASAQSAIVLRGICVLRRGQGPAAPCPASHPPLRFGQIRT
jgi:hypothetical protein